jgi:hypothetical protein
MLLERLAESELFIGMLMNNPIGFLPALLVTKPFRLLNYVLNLVFYGFLKQIVTHSAKAKGR